MAHVEIYYFQLKLSKTGEEITFPYCYEVDEAHDKQKKSFDEIKQQIELELNGESYKILWFVSRRIAVKD